MSPLIQVPTEYPNNERVFVDEHRELRVRVRRDGCVDIHESCNGQKVDDEGADLDYLHICDLEEFIAQLQFVNEQTKGFRE